jgi:hypothetical protein
VLVGKVNAGYNVDGFETHQNGETYVSRSGTPMAINRNSSNGTLLNFYKDGSTVGSIGTASGGVSLGSGDTGLYFEPVSNEIRPFNTTTNASIDNAINLGNSTKRFKDLYLSGGVYLGGTGSANYLDDYEEGTWQPSFQASVTNPTVASQGNSTGRYVKIGNIVHFWFYDSGTNITNAGSGFASVGGLPYTNEAGYYPVFNYVHGTHFATGTDGGYISAGTNTLIFIQRDTISTVLWATGTKYMMISGTYRTT